MVQNLIKICITISAIIFMAGSAIAVDADFRVYLKDHLGNVVTITDEQGTVLQKHVITPYGEISRMTNGDGSEIEMPQSATKRLFTGHYYDQESDMHYMNARYYDVKSKRFASLDPSYYGNSPEEAFSNIEGSTMASNAMMYVEGRATKWVDPSGKLPLGFDVVEMRVPDPFFGRPTSSIAVAGPHAKTGRPTVVVASSNGKVADSRIMSNALKRIDARDAYGRYSIGGGAHGQALNRAGIRPRAYGDDTGTNGFTIGPKGNVTSSKSDSVHSVHGRKDNAMIEKAAAAINATPKPTRIGNIVKGLGNIGKALGRVFGVAAVIQIGIDSVPEGTGHMSPSEVMDAGIEQNFGIPPGALPWSNPPIQNEI